MAVKDRVKDLLRGTLGASPFRPDQLQLGELGPYLSGLVSGLLYVAIFCIIPWLLFPQEQRLLALFAWGAFYYAFAVATAQLTSREVTSILEDGVIRQMPVQAAIRIERELARQFSERRILIVALCAATAAWALSFFAINYDLPTAPWYQVAYWSIGYFWLFLTAARATDVARFYGAFARDLEKNSDWHLYYLDPAGTALISQISAIGQRILLFWIGIACAVATLVLIFRDLKWFVLLVVPTASFFSFVFGSVVFLESEHHIRRVVRKATASTLAVIEEDLGRFFPRRARLSQAEWARLEKYQALHETLSEGASYRSVSLSALSLLIPLAGPAVSLWTALNKAAP
jgi:hypothetical protein